MTGQTGPSAGRGLSTSASFLIIFVGLFLAIGSLYSATGNSMERLGDARDDQRDRHHAVQLTEINVTEARWDVTASNLTVRINNTGDTTLTVPDADTVVDGHYVPISAYERVEVEGQDTDLWRPGEQLFLEDEDTIENLLDTPGRLRFVTETGVADATEVETV